MTTSVQGPTDLTRSTRASSAPAPAPTEAPAICADEWGPPPTHHLSLANAAPEDDTFLSNGPVRHFTGAARPTNSGCFTGPKPTLFSVAIRTSSSITVSRTVVTNGVSTKQIRSVKVS